MFISMDGSPPDLMYKIFIYSSILPHTEAHTFSHFVFAYAFTSSHIIDRNRKHKNHGTWNNVEIVKVISSNEKNFIFGIFRCICIMICQKINRAINVMKWNIRSHYGFMYQEKKRKRECIQNWGLEQIKMDSNIEKFPIREI